MSELSLFFAQNAAAEMSEDFIVSDRFKDKDGAPVAWKIRSMSEAENEEIRRSATRLVKGKNGMKVPETSPEEYMAKLVVASIVFPDLKNAELQKSYGVLGGEQLIKKMLLSGEYAVLVQKVQKVNGFDRDINELVEDVKN
ncbi:phage tail assembly chaperone [Paenibacillus nasutitermitis]|uniref:Phage portal protein n=1 Tax=Paenibacillus nasutitermitis TaxID=1652958 RepID=A0A917E2N8_9BACL|nr:phage portal protein [Paenibacillus nasutitermitis]GGD95148.1 phage portal protein [Paenibacillus nasutitermitis]